MSYRKDRSFTDFVHEKIAVYNIYGELNWSQYQLDKKLLDEIDMHHGIDYVFTNDSGLKIFVQERFRDSKYERYSDATIRYRRDRNIRVDRRKSEFFKMKADVLVYGITNGSKLYKNRHTLTDFLKWVVIDLNFLRKQFKNGQLKIVQSVKTNCWIESGILFCPENFNNDGSSSFVPVDVPMLHSLWGEKAILAQKGYHFGKE